MRKKLIVLLAAKLSALIKKGELTARYYNPGDLFDEVHFILTDDDKPDLQKLQRTVGHAQLSVYSLGKVSFVNTLGWNPFMLRKYVNKTVALIQKIRPQLIRSYGNSINGYIATEVKERLHIPVIVSLHSDYDTGVRKMTPWRTNCQYRLAYEIHRRIERKTLERADNVIAVYESLLHYAHKHGARDSTLIYNVISPTSQKKKEDYALHTPPRILSVSRQIPGKNPGNIIRAMTEVEAELTIVGDGQLHLKLVDIANSCKVSDKVVFEESIPNEALCSMLPDYDVFVVHNDYWGIPKAIMEPLLAGLPIVINCPPIPIAELDGDFVVKVKNKPEAYAEALKRLLADAQLRETLGRAATNYAIERFNPVRMEQKLVELYQSVMPDL